MQVLSTDVGTGGHRPAVDAVDEYGAIDDLNVFISGG
jgi:hypothetical protein